MKIVVDSREQKPLWTGDKIERRKLEVGDYSIRGAEDKIAIERKSLGDLFGTLGANQRRFKSELDKAINYDYFAIVIDGSYSSCVNKDFRGSHFSRMRGYVITSILFTMHLKYGINIFFANSRDESRKIIKDIFKAYIKLYMK